MSKNLSNIERMLRFVLGVALVTWAIAGGPQWAFLGLLPLLTASFAYCPLYQIFGTSRSQDIGRVSPPSDSELSDEGESST